MGLFDSVLGNILAAAPTVKASITSPSCSGLSNKVACRPFWTSSVRVSSAILSAPLGNGENQPITGDHVQQALGSDAINQLAEKLGVDPAQASSTIAQFLPTVADAASPNGEVQQDSNELGDMVGKLFK